MLWHPMAKPTSRATLLPQQAGGVSLTLTATELDAMIEKLCSCSTLCISAQSHRVAARRTCLGPVAHQWCRLGARSAYGIKRAETRFG